MDPQLAAAMLALLAVLTAVGFPIAFVLIALGLAFGYMAMGDKAFTLILERMQAGMSDEALIAVPLFVLMGCIVERSGVADRVFGGLRLVARRLPGALAVATLATSALVAAATGIVGAAVTNMGAVAMPAMARAGYDRRLSAGAVCAGGGLGLLLPPSVMLILYGATTGVPVVKLYAGALLPGALLAGSYIAYAVLRPLLEPGRARALPPSADAPRSGRSYVSLLGSVAPPTILAVVVLGSMLLSWLEPPEAASIGALGSLALGAAYRSLGVRKLVTAVLLAARTTAAIGWLFVGANLFFAVFAFLGGHVAVRNFVVGLDLSPTTFLLLSQFVIFLLGWPLEWTEIVVVFVPLLLPLLDHFGIDPLFFGLVVALNIQTSLLSPPVAAAPEQLRAVGNAGVTLHQIFSGSMPFVWIILAAMAALIALPGIGLWLPAQIAR